MIRRVLFATTVLSAAILAIKFNQDGIQPNELAQDYTHAASTNFEQLNAQVENNVEIELLARKEWQPAFMMKI